MTQKETDVGGKGGTKTDKLKKQGAPVIKRSMASQIVIKCSFSCTALVPNLIKPAACVTFAKYLR